MRCGNVLPILQIARRGPVSQSCNAATSAHPHGCASEGWLTADERPAIHERRFVTAVSPCVGSRSMSIGFRRKRTIALPPVTWRSMRRDRNGRRETDPESSQC